MLTAFSIVKRALAYPLASSFILLTFGMLHLRLQFLLEHTIGERIIGPLSSQAASLILAIILFLPLIYVIISTFKEALRDQQAARYYSVAVTMALEAERKRLSRELHDDTAQALAGLVRCIELCEKELGNNLAKTQHRLQELKGLATEALQGVRRLSADLRPAILDDLGLIPALDWLTSEIKKREGLTVYLEADHLEQRLAPEVELCLYRVVQESLNNVKEHGRATEAIVRLYTESGSLKLVIQDDGQGFVVPKSRSALLRRGHLGLIGMRERVEQMGGSFSIRSKPGEGTVVTAIIPLEMGTDDQSDSGR
ncbi:MAG: sensor histidine kinase [Chloroflexi bacterium]|nr:sensor histidine kinase [Chloroflexota bacterium]MCL5075455.1 sensor histidine kinase [Chloroflexota bacterium]